MQCAAQSTVQTGSWGELYTAELCGKRQVYARSLRRQRESALAKRFELCLGTDRLEDRVMTGLTRSCEEFAFSKPYSLHERAILISSRPTAAEVRG